MIASDNLVIDHRTYTWWQSQNKFEHKDLRAGGPQVTIRYDYDSAYRLTQSTRTPPGDPAGVVEYNLDRVGNRQDVSSGTCAGNYRRDPNCPTPQSPDLPADKEMNQYSELAGCGPRQTAHCR